MRALTKIEKEIVNSMCYHSSRACIIDLLDPFLVEERIYVNRGCNAVDIIWEKFPNAIRETKIKRINEIEQRILILVYLIESLEKEGLIFLFEDANPEIAYNFGQLPVNVLEVSIAIADTNIKNLLVRYIHKSIVFNEEGNIFVKNDCISKEDKWRKKNFITTWVGISLAFFTAIASIVISINSNKNDYSSNINKIEIKLNELNGILNDLSVNQRKLYEKILLLLENNQRSQKTVTLAKK